MSSEAKLGEKVLEGNAKSVYFENIKLKNVCY